MANFGTLEWLVFSAVWLFASFGSGALLAFLYKRLHPDLAFYKLWATWTVVASLAGALIYVIS